MRKYYLIIWGKNSCTSIDISSILIYQIKETVLYYKDDPYDVTHVLLWSNCSNQVFECYTLGSWLTPTRLDLSDESWRDNLVDNEVHYYTKDEIERRYLESKKIEKEESCADV